MRELAASGHRIGSRRIARNIAIALGVASLAAVACQSTSSAPTPGSAVAPKQAQRLPPLSPGDAETLYFEPGSSALGTSQLTTLATFAARLEASPGLRVHVLGYNGSSADETGNRWLSEQRAKNVASYLASQGVAVENVTLQGVGEFEDPTGNARRAVVTVR